MTPQSPSTPCTDAPAGHARVVEKYNPTQPRDPRGEHGGQWISAGGGLSSGSRDALNLADRVQLGDGERLISSDRLAPSMDIDADLFYAVFDGPSGREVRLSAAPTPDDATDAWSGDDEVTARLNPQDVRRLRDDLDDAGKAARGLAKEVDAVWDAGDTPDVKLFDTPVVQGAVGSVHFETWLTDDEPTSWVTHLYTPSSGTPDDADGGVRLNARDLRKLIARLGQVGAALSEAQAAASSGAMLALVPSAADAARLAVDGGVDPTDLHLTLAYLGKADVIDTASRQQLLADLTAAVNGMPVVEGSAFAPAVFNPTGPEPCRVLVVGGDWLDGCHHFLMDTLRLPPAVDRHAPWVPHITLAMDGDFARLEELAGRMGPVTFDRVRLAFAGQYIDIPLAAAEDDDPDDDPEALDGDWSLVEADGDRNNLRTYFTTDPRGLKRWASKKHPWRALFAILRRHLDPERAKRVTSAWYLRVFHRTPNQKSSEAIASTPVRAVVESQPAGSVLLVESGQFVTA